MRRRTVQSHRRADADTGALLSLLLLAIEALNTAIEVLCDHVTPEIHPMIKKAKDLGSAAIFIVGSAMALVLVLTVADLIRK